MFDPIFGPCWNSQLALKHRLPKLEAKEQSDVWKKTEAEFNVQKMIWQSLSPGAQWKPFGKLHFHIWRREEM